MNRFDKEDSEMRLATVFHVNSLDLATATSAGSDCASTPFPAARRHFFRSGAVKTPAMALSFRASELERNCGKL